MKNTSNEQFFYKRGDIENETEYYDIAQNELGGNYLEVILKGIPKENARVVFNYVHNKCCFNSDRETEKRLCKCLRHYKVKDNNCADCCIKKESKYFRREIINADVIDYEIPVSNNGTDKIGEIDLLLKYDGKCYCTEFKPIWNHESLLRMVAEIMTYTYVLKNCDQEVFKKKYKINGEWEKGILFTENSTQHKQWKTISQSKNNLNRIIEKEKISVFCLKLKDNHYEIEKLK